MPSTKRLGQDDDDEGTPYANKVQRLDDNAAFSSASKKKVATSSRTGQACDRCKVRKIRCDARPGGCSPCLQNNTECKTTDRITGRATSRGHTENVEQENTALKVYLVELQAQLRENGLEPRPQPSASQGYTPGASGSSSYAIQPGNGSPWEGQQSNGYNAAHGEQHSSHGSLLPEFRTDSMGDNYLGVASENNWLSPIEGTALALFGTKIDLAEFIPPEPNVDATAMSYKTLLKIGCGGPNSAPRPNLPEYEQCKIFAEWWFRSILQFTPILHKPHFMDLIYRMYHEGYQPTPAETVMVHMMLAVMNFQWSARNGSEQSRSISFEHYHYALSFITQLLASHTLEDIQALTLICSQLRCQPRPEAAWMFTNTTLSLAIELGLHRSAKAWRGSATEPDPHTVEMRKRVFWSLLTFAVPISGKLGRPMPLRLDDFDIEIPEAVNDNLPGEANMTKWKKCSFRGGLQGFKILKIMISLYSTIYSVRTTHGQYDVNVRQIEKELEAFQSQIPPELSGGPQTREEDRIAALYLQLSEAECQLLLHHPSLCRSTLPQAASRNLDICLEASNKLLIVALHLKQLKSLDTTWYYTTVFTAAIFTTLFAYNERQNQITSAELQRLRQDMDAWLDVMGEVGKLLGTGTKLQNAIRNIIDYSLSNFHRHLAAKTASAAVANGGSPAGPMSQSQTPQHSGYSAPKYYNNSYAGGATVDSHPDTNDHYAMETPTSHQNQALGQHATSDPYGYPEPQASMAPYVPSHTATYDTSAYPAEDIKPNIEAQLNAELGAASSHQPTPQPTMTPQPPPPSNYMAYPPPSHTPNAFQSLPPPSMNGQQNYLQFGPAAWRNFADSMSMNVGAQDYVSSANALMALGGAANKPDGSLADGNLPLTSAMSGATFEGMQMPTDGSQSWPLIHYSTGPPPDGQ